MGISMNGIKKAASKAVDDLKANPAAAAAIGAMTGTVGALPAALPGIIDKTKIGNPMPKKPQVDPNSVEASKARLGETARASAADLASHTAAARLMAEQRAANLTQAGQISSESKAAATVAAPQAVQTNVEGIHQTVGADAGQVGNLERMTAAQVNQTPQEQLRQQQLSLAQALEAQSRGEGPSVAQSQLQTATDRAIKQQFAQAAASNMAPALAQRQAMENAANISQDAGRATAELRVQEQANAQNALANVAGSARQQDIGLATDQARLNQEASQVNKVQQDAAQTEQAKMDLNKAQFNADAFNRAAEWSKKLSSEEQMFNAKLKADAEMFNSGQINAANQADAARKLQADIANQELALKARGLDDAAIAASMGMTLDAMKAVTQANLSAESTNLAADLEVMKAQLAAGSAKLDSDTKMLGGLISAGGSIGAVLASDRRAKKNIKDGEKSIEDFLEALSSYEYEYKDSEIPGAAEGKRFGIMIQDIEKTPVGAALVMEDDGVKKMDVGQGLGTALAAIGTLNKKVDKIASFAEALSRGEDKEPEKKSDEKDVGLDEIISAMKNRKKKTGRFA